MRFLLSPVVIMFIINAGCSPKNDGAAKRALPIYGNYVVEANGDTTYHTIGKFAFYDQDSTYITQASTDGKVYVADFFFTTCPSICIPMAREMLRVHEAYAKQPNFLILSHSIDPTFDSVAVLKQYAGKLNLPENTNWRFLTGDETDVYELGEKKYMVTAHQDKTAPGGVLHSGHFLLVDQLGQVRGVYDGTDPDAVDQLIADIKLLL